MLRSKVHNGNPAINEKKEKTHKAGSKAVSINTYPVIWVMCGSAAESTDCPLRGSQSAYPRPYEAAHKHL